MRSKNTDYVIFSKKKPVTFKINVFDWWLVLIFVLTITACGSILMSAFLRASLAALFLLSLNMYASSSGHNMFTKEFNENQLIQTINDAFSNNRIESNVTGCLLYRTAIERDLQPFTENGISRKMFESVANKGVKYQLIDGTVYRSKECMFPARCAGVEHFLRKLRTKIPNTEFVVNVRDYPQTYRRRGRGPDGPVFSFSKTHEHADIMYPAWSFWQGGPAITLYPQGLGRWDLLRERLMRRSHELPWSSKESKGFFRGSRTSSERDFLIVMARQHPDLIAANYTKNQAWKSRADTLDDEPADEISLEDHCRYKYLFNFRGVAASFRLRHLFLCNSLVFHVGSDWQEFFYAELKPWLHYVPIDMPADPVRVLNLVRFFRIHDSFAERIASNGYRFVAKYLTMADIECYWRKLLVAYSKLMRYSIVRDKSLVEIQ